MDTASQYYLELTALQLHVVYLPTNSCSFNCETMSTTVHVYVLLGTAAFRGELNKSYATVNNCINK